MKLTVYFNGQYWVGVVEHNDDFKLKACQFIFGPEPKDGDVMDFVEYQMLSLLSSSKQQVAIREPKLELDSRKKERKVTKCLKNFKKRNTFLKCKKQKKSIVEDNGCQKATFFLFAQKPCC